jgi:hypothetical protein
MSAHEFRGDDTGYLSWLGTHTAGYLINIHKNYNPTGARLHQASCYTLRNQRGTLTDPYIKVCADQVADLAASSARKFSHAVAVMPVLATH